MIAVEVRDLSKKYKLYQKPSHRLMEWMTGSTKKLHQEFWALKDVSFELEKGKAMGIIGPNGAGKSTLLKVITGTTSPTTGGFSAIGRVASLLELGAGFHPEFTGRQNLRMNAKMLGLTDEEIDDRMEDIVRFAELGPFIDQPVRTYSSGMYVRLGFAIASSVRPDVLIVDEALSVGDAYFQRKSLDRIKYFRDHGVTILFVSHDLSIVRRFCDDALWLNEGRVQNVGEAGKVIKSYELWEKKKEEINLGVEYDLDAEESVPDGSGAEAENRKKKLRVLGSTWGSGEVKITRVEMLDSEGNPKWTFNTGEPVTIRYHFYAFQEVPNPIFGMNIHRLDGVYVFGTNNYNIHPSSLSALEKGEGFVDFHVDELDLHCGTYFLTANVYLKPDEPFWSEPADFHHQMYEFKIWSGQPQHGIIPLDGSWSMGGESATEGTVVPDRLDLASKSVTNYLLDGWHDIEQSEGEEPFSYVWAEAQSSFLMNIPRQAAEVCLDIHGNQLADEEGQSVELFLDGLPLGAVTIRDQGYSLHCLAVPEEVKGRTVRGELVSGQVWTPREVFGSEDDRKLSIAVKGIWTR